MLISRSVLSSMLCAAALTWQRNTDKLGDIDSRFGDGDHGVTIGKISALILSRAESWEENLSMNDFMESLAAGTMGINGGSAGPLYGTMLEGLAAPLQGKAEADGNTLKEMFNSCLEAMFEITKARVGDKTMMDALIPAVQAGCAAEGGLSDILSSAASAAEDGAHATEKHPSKFGRARSYGEKTIGTPDAGAVSTALFFRGLSEGYESAVRS